MRSLSILAAGLLEISVLSAQSTPGWWKYVPFDATSVVGIRWQSAQSTLFAPAIVEELRRLPDFDLWKNSANILIAGPSMLAILSGSFAPEDLRRAAAARGLRQHDFEMVELWVPVRPNEPGVAIISDKLLLIGCLQDLREALKSRKLSPLLSRAAQYSEVDLWVIASRLPDPLASRFVPLEIEATAFEGSVSAWDGLHLVAAIEQPNATQALEFADDLEAALDSRPAMAEGTKITAHERSVLVRMDLDERQLAASLRPVTVPSRVAATVQTTPGSPLPAIKILGLSTGTREIPLGR